jgi:GrpB-like predicted nucleotidyltransferase (UPF0157 family)
LGVEAEQQLTRTAPGAPVQVVRFDPSWSERFETERALLSEAIGELTTGGIHHIGGTAVAGVDAEPVIDILVGVEGPAATEACVAPLTALGYEPQPAAPAADFWLRTASDALPSYLLCLAPEDSPRYAEGIAFRDLLRSNRQAAMGYAGMKRDLARLHRGNRQRYTAAKIELIEAVLSVTGLGVPGP